MIYHILGVLSYVSFAVGIGMNSREPGPMFVALGFGFLLHLIVKAFNS